MQSCAAGCPGQALPVRGAHTDAAWAGLGEELRGPAATPSLESRPPVRVGQAGTEGRLQRSARGAAQDPSGTTRVGAHSGSLRRHPPSAPAPAVFVLCLVYSWCERSPARRRHESPERAPGASPRPPQQSSSRSPPGWEGLGEGPTFRTQDSSGFCDSGRRSYRPSGQDAHPDPALWSSPSPPTQGPGP